jgi:hypothetical protein
LSSASEPDSSYTRMDVSGTEKRCTAGAESVRLVVREFDDEYARSWTRQQCALTRATAPLRHFQPTRSWLYHVSLR